MLVWDGLKTMRSESVVSPYSRHNRIFNVQLGRHASGVSSACSGVNREGGDSGAGLTPRMRKLRLEYAGAGYHGMAHGRTQTWGKDHRRAEFASALSPHGPTAA